jgi:hypothetical protein
LFLKDCFALDLAPDYERKTTFLWAVIGQWTKFLRAKSDLKLLDIDEQQIRGWRDFESRINPGSRLKESADLPNRMIDLNWRRQYDIKQKRQRARLTTLIRRSPRPSCQSLPISDFGKRLGSAGKGFLADVGIAVAHGRAFMAH